MSERTCLECHRAITDDAERVERDGSDFHASCFYALVARLVMPYLTPRLEIGRF